MFQKVSIAMSKNAFVLGGSGEVGKEVLKCLVESSDFSSVKLIGRREIELPQDYTKVQQVKVDFDSIRNHADAFQGCDIGFCCLGTTRGKAGADGFVKIDHDYVVESAKVAKEQGTSQFHVVTASNSNANSWFLYPKTKGLVEEHLKELSFPHLAIYRPALLLCDRTESRMFEGMARKIVAPIDKSGKISVSTKSVAKCMVKTALEDLSDSVIIKSNADIFKEGKD